MKTYIVEEPLERISIDILGPVPRTHRGNKYILVVTDYFKRYAEAYSLPNIEAAIVADKLLEEFICRFGLPLFTAELFTEMCKKLHIDKTRNSPFHPQSSGLVERLNRTIEDMLSKFVSKHQKDWDHYLPYIMMAYRSSVHETLGETLCFMMMGREATLPVDLLYGSHNSEQKSVNEYVNDFITRLETVHEVVRDRLLNAKRNVTIFQVPKLNIKLGKVCFYMTLESIRRSPKFQMRWSGPYTIVSELSDLLYKIQAGPKQGKNCSCEQTQII